jgi:choline dehydrogenase
MTYQRPTIQSMEQWADMVGDDSYKWDNILPFFEKSLNFTPPDMNTRAANATPQYDASSLGNGLGPLSVTFARYAQPFSSWAQIALKQVGIKPIKGFTSGKLIGSSYDLLTIDGTFFTRESSETSFLRRSLFRSNPTKPNLIVFDSTLAKKILFDSGKRATGVVVNTSGRQYTLKARKEVIVSAGVFKSPQILMISGIGPAATLKKFNISVVADRPGVGQNMQAPFHLIY